MQTNGQTMTNHQLNEIIISQAQEIRQLNLAVGRAQVTSSNMLDKIWSYRRRLEFLEQQFQGMQQAVNILKYQNDTDHGTQY